jgi:glycosyltransferase involved in cell wall biosynthesis
MHIVLLNYSYDADYRSVEEVLDRHSSLRDWAGSLLTAGAQQVSVIQRFRLNALVRRDGVKYIFCAGPGSPFPKPWTFLPGLHRTVATLEPDLVHVNGLIFPLQTWLLRKTLPRPGVIVLQDHANVPPQWTGRDNFPPGGFPTLAAFLWRVLQRPGLRAADGFLFAAAAQAQPLRRLGLIRPHQPVYEVMEASTHFRPLPKAVARTQSGLPGKPALLWVGRLNYNKDPLTVLAGFEKALPALPEAHLTMIYAGEELLPQVQSRLAASPALATRVHLGGIKPHPEMATWYSAADLFVLGSHWEGSGYALIEALACGLVPVVTDIPSFRVLTAEGKFGALFSPGDAAGLAQALVELGPRDLEALRPALLEHFEGHFSWPALGRRALAAYQEIRRERLQRLA